MTVGLARISSAMASRKASRTVMVFIGVPSAQSGEAFETTATGAATGAAAATGAGAAVAATGAAFAATASPSSDISRIGVFTFTPAVPSATNNAPTRPSSVASNSIVALSVSISAKIWPDFTTSPTLTSHLAKVPSSIVGDRAGISTSVAIVSLPLRRKYLSKARSRPALGCLWRIRLTR